MLQAGAKLLSEEPVTMVQGTEAHQSKQTLGGDRRAAKVIACHRKKKRGGKALAEDKNALKIKKT